MEKICLRGLNGLVWRGMGTGMVSPCRGGDVYSLYGETTDTGLNRGTN